MTDYGWSEVTIGDTRFAVSHEEPIAVIRSPALGIVQVTWPDFDIGGRSTGLLIWPTNSGVWLTYTASAPEGDASRPLAILYLTASAEIIEFEVKLSGRAVGATRHGLWIVATSDPGIHATDEWTAFYDLQVLSPSDSVRKVRLDRRVFLVLDDGEAPRLMAYGGPPELESAFGGQRVRKTVVEIQLPDELPDIVSIPAFEPRTVDEMRFLSSLRPSLPVHRSPRADDPRARWSLPSLTGEEIQVAVAAVVTEFSDLDAAGLTDPKIDVIGEFPHTRVEVTFAHPAWNPSGRLRRTVDVFDRAGRIIDNQYASVHLMEDLATSPPKEPGEPVDGVMEF